jgi:cytochrome c
MNLRGMNYLTIAASILAVITLVDQSRGAPATGSGPGAGRDVFAKRCSGCHAADSNMEGPRLRGVLGRRAGTIAGYPYSDALRNSGITWNEELLTKWLENPGALVKDTDMEFRVSNADERAALVAYLKSLGG